MEAIEREEIYRIAREVVKQELDILLPVSREISDLKIVVHELVQAQVRTEKRFEELVQTYEKSAEGLTTLEKAIHELAQAQAKTEARLEELIVVVKEMQREMTDIRRQFGGLAHAVGFQLEDRAYFSLPKLLEEEFGIKVKERLSRKMFRTYRERLWR